MKQQITELSDTTIKQYIERAKQVRAELQAHQGEYRGIRNRMIQRKDRGIERAEKRLQKPVKESEEKRWVVYVDDMAVAHYPFKSEAEATVKMLEPKYTNIQFSIRHERVNKSIEKNQERLKNVKR